MVLGLTLSFVGGMFSEETRMEKIAEYATKVVNRNTDKKKYCAITVGKTNDSGPILNSDDEFHNLYGTFRQTKVTFASVMNVDKARNIFIKNNDHLISDNLSALYVGPVGAIKYNGHYKHYTYPVEIMFPDEKLYDICRYVVYISQTHADRLLESKGIQKNNNLYSDEQYQSLLKTLIDVSIDGKPNTFIIQNIYFEQNYYQQGLSDVMGDFVMVSYYMPENLRDEQQNVYFMSEYDYQNKYFMEYINKAYSNKKYSVKVNHYNIKGNIDDDYLLSFYYGSKNGNFDWLSAIIMVLSVASVAFSLLLFALSNKKIKPIKYVIYGVCLFGPYLSFYLLYSITNNVIFLSRTATRMYTILSLIYVASYIIVCLIKKHNSIKKISTKKEGHNNENVDI